MPRIQGFPHCLRQTPSSFMILRKDSKLMKNCAKMVSEFIRGRCAAVATSVGGFLVVVGLFFLYIRCSGMASGGIKLEPRVGGLFGAAIIRHGILVVEHPLVQI